MRGLDRRSVGESVPFCEYRLPTNATELVQLMSVLKRVELGVCMFLSESLLPIDTRAVILLSSISSVAAKQSALIQAYMNSTASKQSFETPFSGEFAYNLALGYVQPGSGAVELPLPILPMLTINNKTAAYAQPGANVTFNWDGGG